jgi:mRNA-degrading endonuclease HigB of HigAB toxin-antitoxin module
MANRYPIREYKDNLFRVIFNEKKQLLALYNALNNSNYDDPEQLEIVTLENVFFLKMKNDVAFLINTNELYLVEHAVQ